ncbi:hypothetical protein PIB30_035456 [Stylosanthes scabra]|uniref:Uncharacterized protein n=1 Tax=Stylosanthes scabra TaxID=79078 RepID=A0ABU6UFU0_9FABA|nr:hypothetical protein [Stylosanthes scabra]
MEASYAYALVPNLPNGRAAQGRDVYAWLPSTPRHAYTASEFTPVTRIYSSPSWDQYLTVGMPRIRRGLTSPLYPGWCVSPR